MLVNCFFSCPIEDANQFSSCLFIFRNKICSVFNHSVSLYVMCSLSVGTFKISSLIWFSVL